jgi:hypothetical protein
MVVGRSLTHDVLLVYRPPVDQEPAQATWRRKERSYPTTGRLAACSLTTRLLSLLDDFVQPVHGPVVVQVLSRVVMLPHLLSQA